MFLRNSVELLLGYMWSLPEDSNPYKIPNCNENLVCKMKHAAITSVLHIHLCNQCIGRTLNCKRYDEPGSISVLIQGVYFSEHVKNRQWTHDGSIIRGALTNEIGVTVDLVWNTYFVPPQCSVFTYKQCKWPALLRKKLAVLLAVNPC
jgi:hypothetical protein